MIWNQNSTYNKHAVLSPSTSHWVNYTEERFVEYYATHRKAAIGTKLHKLAEDLISLKVRLPNTLTTLSMFVNDAIGFRMDTEVVLFYSDNAFGTADAISFDAGILRIHDLKTGTSPAKLTQLEIYAALFCLEYEHRPTEIEIALRVYQNDEVVSWSPSPSVISNIMAKIQEYDLLIKELENG